MLKVLMQIRPDAFLNMGGDTIQVVKTAEYLRKLGVDVDISLTVEKNLEQYDIIHLFNITRIRSTYSQFSQALNKNKPIVLSPIYWNMTQLFTQTASFILKRSARILTELLTDASKQYLNRTIPYAISEYRNSFGSQDLQLWALTHASAIVTNANSETEVLIRDFPSLRRASFFVVPNAIDSSIFSSNSNLGPLENFREGYVLCVARFGIRKNQLSLIRAIRNTRFELVLIGGVTKPTESDKIKAMIDRIYFEDCLREARKSRNIHVFHQMAQESLARFYYHANLHALPSLYETPGLSSLEAAAFGTNLVVSKEGSTFDYFGNDAFYCDPQNLDSIYRCIEHAFHLPKNDKLRTRVQKNFTWVTVAERLEHLYNKLQEMTISHVALRN